MLNTGKTVGQILENNARHTLPYRSDTVEKCHTLLGETYDQILWEYARHSLANLVHTELWSNTHVHVLREISRQVHVPVQPIRAHLDLLGIFPKHVSCKSENHFIFC